MVKSCKPLTQTPKPEDHLFVAGCPQQFIQYICSYPTYMEAICSIHNPSTHNAMVTRDPINVAQVHLL